jgi:capsular polysaccharide biosynthesis protein
LTNPLYTTKQAIKYGILMAAVAFVFAAVIIILLDKSDKRLRDTEIITKKFNIPLLGIVPTIDELNEDFQAKKNANKTTEVK